MAEEETKDEALVSAESDLVGDALELEFQLFRKDGSAPTGAQIAMLIDRVDALFEGRGWNAFYSARLTLRKKRDPGARAHRG